MPEEDEIAGEPDERRHPQTPVGHRHQRVRDDAVCADVPDGANAGHDALAQRVCGLHDAVGDAAGKIVLEERPALADHMPVALPADERGRAGDENHVPDRNIGQQHERPHHEDEGDHADEHRPLLAQRRHAVGCLHERHQAPDEEGYHGIERSDSEACGEHRRIPPFRLAHEVPIERGETRRRTTHDAVSAFDFLKQNNSMHGRIHVGPEPEFHLLWPRLPETG